MATSSASPPTTQVGGHGLLVTSPDQWLCSSDHHDHDHGDDNPGGRLWWGDGAGQCVSEDLLSRPGPSSHRRQCSCYLVGHRVSCQLRWLETKAAIYRYFSILILKHCSEWRPVSETHWKWVQQFQSESHIPAVMLVNISLNILTSHNYLIDIALRNIQHTSNVNLYVLLLTSAVQIYK